MSTIRCGLSRTAVFMMGITGRAVVVTLAVPGAASLGIWAWAAFSATRKVQISIPNENPVELVSCNGRSGRVAATCRIGRWKGTTRPEQTVLRRLATKGLAAIIGITAIGATADELVPLFLPASDWWDHGRQGFVRMINHSDRGGEVAVQAIDDEGTVAPVVTLAIEANAIVHFNSDDLEYGNAEKGLDVGSGPGAGYWRLELESELDIEALSFVRTMDGFLTAIHDTVPVANGRHRIATFNPGSNRGQRSFLRLINLDSESPASVSITGVDDDGRIPGEGATVEIPAGAALTYWSTELEAGGVKGLDGSIGDGRGKWRLVLETRGSILAMSLLSSLTGHLTNLSTAPDRGADSMETPSAVFATLVSASVQNKCVGCHVEGGEAGRSRLVFQPKSNPSHLAANRDALIRLMAHSEDGGRVILDKIRGWREHGGGMQVDPDTAEFTNFERAIQTLEPEPELERLRVIAEFIRADAAGDFRYNTVDSMRLRPGGEATLGLFKQGNFQQEEAEWETSDPSVVGISQGRFADLVCCPAVTAIAKEGGRAIVTARLRGQTASTVVRVSTRTRSAGRSFRDRPDDFDGKQIHFVYVVQEGGRDGERDMHGFFPLVADEMQRWLRKAAGMRWRIDSYEGLPDVSFLSIADNGIPTLRQMEEGLKEREGGALNPGKVYALFLDYDGTHGRMPYTGRASGAAALTLIHSPHYQMVAGIAAHELIHVFGAVPACAPNRSGPHSNDYALDIMSDGTLVGGALDWNSDDYFRHGRDDCTDTVDSPYWESID